MVLLPTGPDLEQIFPIVEIFHSIQGEGHHTGASSVFIRFCSSDSADATSGARGATPNSTNGMT